MLTLDLSGFGRWRWKTFFNRVSKGSRYELASVRPAGFKTPIYLRRGTSDVRNFRQIFIQDAFSFLPIRPRTILDLGGYIGLASLALAQRYPDARILLVEPDPDNFLLAELNCRPFPNITCLRAGVWSKAGHLTVDNRTLGDWGIMMREVAETDAPPLRIACHSVGDLIERAGFSGGVDFLKIDIEGSEKALFDDPNAHEWVDRCKVISCELHDRMVPGCTESYRSLMAGRGFVQGRDFEREYYLRSSGQA